MHIMCRVVCVLLESGPNLWVPPIGMIPRSGTLASFLLRYLRLRAFNSFIHSALTSVSRSATAHNARPVRTAGRRMQPHVWFRVLSMNPPKP